MQILVLISPKVDETEQFCKQIWIHLEKLHLKRSIMDQKQHFFCPGQSWNDFLTLFTSLRGRICIIPTVNQPVTYQLPKSGFV